MDNMKKNEILDNTNTFLDNTFTSLDLNQDFEKIYEIITDDELQEDFNKQVELTNLRNEKYKDIEVLKYKNLPEDFKNVVDDILNCYECINVSDILTDNYEDSRNNKVILDTIDRQSHRLENMIKSYVKELTTDNDNKQKKFSAAYFNSLDIDERFKNQLIDKYNDLVLQSSKVTSDIYLDLELQLQRKESIKEILNILNIEEKDKNESLNEERLNSLNRIINLEILKYTDRINYLQDLIPENSKYIEKFNEFRNFFNKLIAYDDTSYESARQTIEILGDEFRLDEYIRKFENLFIEEINSSKEEEKSNDEKVKNLKDIWKDTITDVYSFNPNEDYYFICTNNQFVDPRYQAVLITKKEVGKVESYEDYQIGFICGYNNNIIYTTDKKDIMEVDTYDTSALKTPKELEQEFINFETCNRIALDGFKTKIEAVYYINDNDNQKYTKALALANMYRLPLIVLKK